MAAHDRPAVHLNGKGNGKGSGNGSGNGHAHPPRLPLPPSLSASPPPPTLSPPPAPTAPTLRSRPSLAGTSTSSHAAAPITDTAAAAPPPSRSPSTLSLSQEATATLINRLYARLDVQGVPGDGWDEGRERSRDGIISHEQAEGLDTTLLHPSPPSKDPLRPPLAPSPSPSSSSSSSSPESQKELDEKEEEILRRVDRYGFFASSHPSALACQYNRLATLTSSAFSLPLGSTTTTSSSTTTTTAAASRTARRPTPTPRLSTLPLPPRLTARELARISKWASMLHIARRDPGGNALAWDVAAKWDHGRRFRTVQRRVFKGVPDRWRRAVWTWEMERMDRARGARGGSLEELEQEYRRLLLIPTPQDIQIDLDVPRTISGHVLFHTRYGTGQRALFHVLHAFALRADAIGGYCQGMGALAATLLCYFEPERAYAAMVRLFYTYDLRHIFAPGFPGLLSCFYVQERLVQKFLPRVWAAFEDHAISTSAYATKWYITLFANSVPFSTQLRLWDGLLLEGLDVLVLTSLALIWSFRDEFVAPTASFETILSRLSSYFLVEDEDALLRWVWKALRKRGVRDSMARWRDDWDRFVKDGSAPDRVT